VKILILKPSSLGDVVQALPVLRLLKLHQPRSRIYWWIDSDLAPLLEDDPDLSGLIRFERRRWASPRHWPELLQCILDLRARQFDWVIDLQSLARTGLVAWLANGGVTLGLDDAREGARGLYDYAVPRPSYLTHAVDWYKRVLPHLGVPVHDRFDWLPPRPRAADSLARRWPQASGRRWIVVQPGARWENKRWPLASFAETVRRLSQEMPEVWFAVTGGPGDQALGEAFRASAPDRTLDLTGRTSLPEMVEWIRLSELMITNDSGPMHVAAALGKPVVALFGPTEPARTGPYGQSGQVLRHAVPCAPCLKSRCAWARPLECLTTIRPEEVCARARVLLAK
jgi:lipopolysaccharide heptosyltransferase II